MHFFAYVKQTAIHHCYVFCSIAEPSKSPILILLLLFLIIYYLMTETEQKQKPLEETGVKQRDKSEDNAQDYFSQLKFSDQYDEEECLIEQQKYLQRLREQRERIQQLTDLLRATKKNFEEEVSHRKSLEAELESYRNVKITNSSISGSNILSIEQVHIQMNSIQEENEQLKGEVENLQREFSQAYADWQAKNKRLTYDFNLQLKKHQLQLERLKDLLYDKEDEVKDLKKELQYKEKQYKQLSNQSTLKASKLKENFEERLKQEQKKVEKIQDKIKNSNSQQFEMNNNISKEIDKLREDNLKLRKNNDDKQKEHSYQIDRYKAIISSLRKELKAKDKEHRDLKASHEKFEREKQSQVSEKEEMKVQITKIREQYQSIQMTLAKKDSDFAIDKKNMLTTIEKQGKAIGQLTALKSYYENKIQQLTATLKRKSDLEQQRRTLLKYELKQIDKLEKVIDKLEKE